MLPRLIAATTLVWLAVPACATNAVTMTFTCEGAAPRPVQPTDLWGSWDVVWNVGGRPNIGTLSLGIIDGRVAGTLTLPAGVVVLRHFGVDGQSVRFSVGSPQGDVRFDGAIAGNVRRMCGTVTYHDGRTMPMLVERRVGPQGARGG